MHTKVITASEFRSSQAKYFDLAERQRVVIKRGRKLITLTVADELDTSPEDWYKGFFAIPEQYRCNPYDISPSGDLFFADKRNVEALKQSSEIASQQVAQGKVTKVRTNDELANFLDSL